MAVFTPPELELLAEASLGRIATTSADHVPGVAPVTFHVDGEGASAVIRLVPETVWSWGLNAGAETAFGPIEKRSV